MEGLGGGKHGSHFGHQILKQEEKKERSFTEVHQRQRLILCYIPSDASLERLRLLSGRHCKSECLVKSRSSTLKRSKTTADQSGNVLLIVSSVLAGNRLAGLFCSTMSAGP